MICIMLLLSSHFLAPFSLISASVISEGNRMSWGPPAHISNSVIIVFKCLFSNLLEAFKLACLLLFVLSSVTDARVFCLHTHAYMYKYVYMNVHMGVYEKYFRIG